MSDQDLEALVSIATPGHLIKGGGLHLFWSGQFQISAQKGYPPSGGEGKALSSSIAQFWLLQSTQYSFPSPYPPTCQASPHLTPEQASWGNLTDQPGQTPGPRIAGFWVGGAGNFCKPPPLLALFTVPVDWRWDGVVKKVSLVSVSDFVTPCPVACQAPLSMEFSRQECWSG